MREDVDRQGNAALVERLQTRMCALVSMLGPDPRETPPVDDIRAVVVARLLAEELGGTLTEQRAAISIVLSACPGAMREANAWLDGRSSWTPLSARARFAREQSDPEVAQAQRLAQVFRLLLDIGLGRAPEGEALLWVRRPRGRPLAPPLEERVWKSWTVAARANWLAKQTGRRVSAVRSALEKAGESGIPESFFEPEGRMGGGDWYVRGGVRDRRLGAHYTPSAVVDEVVAHTLAPLVSAAGSVDELLAIRICDPAVGAGGFLVGAWRALVRAVVQADPNRWSRRCAGIEVARRCLYGADVDPLAVGLSRLVLSLLGGDEAGHLVQSRVVYGDALVGLTTPQIDLVLGVGSNATRALKSVVDPSERTRAADACVRRLASVTRSPSDLSRWIRRSCGGAAPDAVMDGPPPLHWSAMFPAVFQGNRGFDAVLTNPPYRSALAVSSESGRRRRRLLKALHPDFTRGAFDLSTVFWSRITRTLLRPGGRYGAVVPTASLSSTAAWQNWMHENWRPDVFLLYPVDCFADARIRTTAVIGGSGKTPTVQVDDRTEPGRLRGTVVWDTVDGPWFAATRLHRSAPAPAVQTTRLDAVVQISAGCTTDGAYRLAECLVDAEHGDGLRLVTTGALDRFACHWGVRRQRFLRRDLRHPRWPSHKGSSPLLRARDAQMMPKILVAGLTAVLEAWFDEHGTAGGVVQTWVLQPGDEIDPFVLLGLLNSAVFSQLYMGRHGGASMSGRQTTIKKRALAAMPIPGGAVGLAVEEWTGDWGTIWSPQTSEPELRSLVRTVAMKLQRSRETSGRKLLDWVLHAAVARLYGHTEAQARRSLNWYGGRSRGETPGECWPVRQLDAVMQSLAVD